MHGQISDRLGDVEQGGNADECTTHVTPHVAYTNYRLGPPDPLDSIHGGGITGAVLMPTAEEAVDQLLALSQPDPPISTCAICCDRCHAQDDRNQQACFDALFRCKDWCKSSSDRFYPVHYPKCFAACTRCCGHRCAACAEKGCTSFWCCLNAVYCSYGAFAGWVFTSMALVAGVVLIVVFVS